MAAKKAPPTPRELARTMRSLAEGPLARDTESRHIEADRLLCDALRALGYGAAVKAFRALPKWYA